MKFLRILPVAALIALAACNSGPDKKGAESQADTTETQAVAQTETQTAATSEVIDVKPGEDPVATPGKPVVIDFSAVWCGPCQQFKPVYHKAASEYASKATFYAADLDECTELGQKYNVTNIPCVVILKDGAEPVIQVGAMDEAAFKELLDKSL